MKAGAFFVRGRQQGRDMLSEPCEAMEIQYWQLPRQTTHIFLIKAAIAWARAHCTGLRGRVRANTQGFGISFYFAFDTSDRQSYNAWPKLRRVEPLLWPHLEHSTRS